MNTFEEDRIVLPRMAQKALDKAKALERKKLEKGYRYIQVDTHTRILVECTKEGSPTLYGYDHIARYKEKNAIK